MAGMATSATISRPVDFFPVPVDQQLAAIRTVAAGLPDADVAWISESRDFAETERYTAKANVDAALVSSPAVSEERRRIEQLFSAAEPTIAAGRYLELLRQGLAALHHAFVQAIGAPPSDDLQTHRAFWQRATVLADVDNAHAMYLSSDNWPFSVFHALIDELSELVGGDHEALGPLLTAGIQDARTSVYQAFGDEYRGLDRQAFAPRSASETTGCGATGCCHSSRSRPRRGAPRGCRAWPARRRSRRAIGPPASACTGASLGSGRRGSTRSARGTAGSTRPEQPTTPTSTSGSTPSHAT